jgi:hypothetical protein
MKISTTPLVVILTFVSLCFLAEAQAVSPPPDGGYPNGNTAEGDNALLSLSSGFYNTAVGLDSLLSITAGNFCTGVGAGTLLLNTGNENTATGAGALLSNTTADGNTANGAFALFNNATGVQNAAVGDRALFNNIGGEGNVAIGSQALFQNNFNFNIGVGAQALFANVGGLENTAIGYQALLDNTSGDFNAAVGGAALLSNTTGNDNTACGGGALTASTGSDNTALGFQAGIAATTGDNNVYIGSGMSGVAGESNACYIASIFGQTIDPATTTIVGIDSNNKLGTVASSKRFKEDIKPMDKASEALLALKPVTFHYKSDSKATPQFGLVAEEVAEVNPNLVVRDKKGEILTVHYDQVNAMLLNVFLKEHKAFLEEQSKVQRLEAALEAVNVRLKDQDAKIERVTTQVKANPIRTQIAKN